MKLPINKWILILENIYLKKRNHTTKISKDLNITYSHTYRLVKVLIEYSYIQEKVKTGRIVWLELTDRGIKLTDYLSKAMQILREDNILEMI